MEDLDAAARHFPAGKEKIKIKRISRVRNRLLFLLQCTLKPNVRCSHFAESHFSIVESGSLIKLSFKVSKIRNFQYDIMSSVLQILLIFSLC